MKHTMIKTIGISLVVVLITIMVACGGDSDESATSESDLTPQESEGSGITESGLEYIEIEEGTGLKVQAGDIVEVHYTGTLEDGTKFDSSLDRGQPISFTVGAGQMIAGFDEGVALMKEGGKAKLVIPPELGYGEAGSGSGAVPPNATITFEVELLSIERPDPPQEVDESAYQEIEPGIKYYDLVVGDGESPEYGDTAVVHFIMWDDKGIRLQDTIGMEQPAIVPIQEGLQSGGIIEGIFTMNIGGTRQLVIPPEIGYCDYPGSFGNNSRFCYLHSTL